MEDRKNQLQFWRKRQQIAPYMFIAPFLLFFLVFMAYPFCYMIFLSFFQWSGFGERRFVGLNNFAFLLSDRIFWKTIENGFVIFFMYVPVMLVSALIIAVILNQKSFRLKGVFRTFIFLPNITNVVAVSFVFLLMFSSSGFINSTLVSMGFDKVNFLGTAFSARATISGLVLWRWLGYNMILLLAGLQNISEDLYEAARIDGASTVRQFFTITIPLLKPLIVFAAILSTSGTFALIAEPMLITNGNPGNATLSTTFYMYKESFQGFNFGYASTISIAYFVLMCILSLLQLKISGSKD